MNINNNKYNAKDNITIAAQLYIAKGLSRNPSKILKFIKDNKKYCPYITDDMIEQIMKENNITKEDIEKHGTVRFM